MTNPIHNPEAGTAGASIQDVMFEVFEYAKISDGIDQAEGDARDDQRAAMLAQDRKIRKMLAASPADVAAPAPTWPTMPPSKGQSPVLFEDGYAEGWAKCLSMCKAAFATPDAPKGEQK